MSAAMRPLILALAVACSSPPKPAPSNPDPAQPAPPPAPSPAPAPAAASETLAADTPKTTTTGNSFTAPAGWTFSVRGDATILGAPEGNSWIALVDIRSAADADAAVKAAWAAYKPDAKYQVKIANDVPPKDGWTDRRVYSYDLPPNDKRVAQVSAQRANGVWTVIIFDFAEAVAEKRIGQLLTIFSRWVPKGGERESF